MKALQVNQNLWLIIHLQYEVILQHLAEYEQEYCPYTLKNSEFILLSSAARSVSNQ